ncbi:MAG: YdcF family protein, partial [Treponemataceae bacterium]|nr:YdcF family protein [Treponemataceae bacterium]
NKIGAILDIIIGALLIIYDIVIVTITNGTFLQKIFNTTNLFFIMGAYLVFVGFWRLKTKTIFWKSLNKYGRTILCVISFFIIQITAIGLGIILTEDVFTKFDNKAENPEYVFLLGGGIDKNGKVSLSVLNKVEKTCEYWHSCKAEGQEKLPVIIVSGGTQEMTLYPESSAIKTELLARGIPQEYIYLEENALDTIQNFQYSVDVISDYDNKSREEVLNSQILISTNFFHMNRAKLIAKRLGFKNISGLVSSSNILYIPSNYLREILAYVKLFGRIIITGEPSPIQSI